MKLPERTAANDPWLSLI